MLSPIKLLLVEDNPGDSDLIKITLARSKLKMTFDLVVDGTEAMAFLRGEGPYANKEKPDLILLDLNLPKMDGREVLAEIRKDSRLKSIPVVVLTSSDAERDIALSYEMGANCYVLKPVGFKEFQEIVHAIEGFWFTVVRLP